MEVLSKSLNCPISLAKHLTKYKGYMVYLVINIKFKH